MDASNESARFRALHQETGKHSMTDDSSAKPAGRPLRTLKDNEISATPTTDRRRVVFGMAIGLVGVASLAGCVAPPPGPRGGGGGGVSDQDSGPNADPPGRGRGGGGGGGGISDQDSGPNADPPGRGRGSRSGGGVSDSDSGPNADPPGRGRGSRGGGTGLTDSDAGPNADGPGRGRSGR
jgi:hypothetical protein